MNNADLFLAACRAFLIALVLTPIVRDVFRAYNVVDRPGKRKVHAYPIPRVGGIPIMVAYFVTIWMLPFPERPGPAANVWTILPAAGAIFLTGLVDDFFNLSPRVKLAGQFAAAVLAWIYGIRLESLAGIPLPPWVGFPLEVMWLLFTTNALNLIDGLDGLCTGMGFFATLTFFAAATVEDIPLLAVAAVPLAGGLLGFLFFNFNPATVFLGDSGALSIGFVLGCFGLIWANAESTFASSLVPFLALAVPLLDVLLSIARRSIKGQPVFQADRGHTHHRLLNRGLSVRQSALVLYGFAATGGLFGVLLDYHPALGGYHFLVVLGFCVACWLGVKQLRYAEFEVAGRLMFKGGFKRAVARNVRLGQLEATLRSAEDESAWWQALASTGRDAGWTRLAWRNTQGEVEQILSPATAAWAFTVRIGPNEIVEIEGREPDPAGTAIQPTDNPMDLAALSVTIRATLSEKRAAAVMAR